MYPLERIMPFMVPIIIVPSGLVLIGWTVAALINAIRHRMNLRVQTELHNRLLEKFDSASEFTAYLQTEAGRRFFDNLTSERVTPATKILSSVQKGAITTVLGLGLLVLALIYHPLDQGAFTIFGVIALALGIGFLVSAGIAYRLSKNWGLMTNDGRGERHFAVEP